MIGFFDSGIGGVTVLKEAVDIMPGEDYLYFADTRNVPYGEKGREEVRECVLSAVEKMAAMGIKALVVACNTATSIAINCLRRQYDFPVVGMEPAVKPAVAENGNSGRRVLVLATALTLREEKYHNLVRMVDQYNIVDSIALPGLVEFAENLEFEGEKVLAYLKDRLGQLDLQSYGTVVLGCTHFTFFTKTLRQFLPPHVNIIHGAGGTVRRLKNVLEERGLLGGGTGRVLFCSSGDAKADEAKCRKALEIARGL